jgi:hypothetical protein
MGLQNLQKRLKALESGMLTGRVTLLLPDGRERELVGPPGYVLRLLSGASSGDLTDQEASDWEAIRRCVGAKEPGRMIQMIKALMEPADERPDR